MSFWWENRRRALTDMEAGIVVTPIDVIHRIGYPEDVGYDQIAYQVINRFLSRAAWIPMEGIKQVQLLEEHPAQL